MTWEEAKQQIAENHGEKSFAYHLQFNCINMTDCSLAYTEAAELWQKSNIERIKELEDVLKKIRYKIESNEQLLNTLIEQIEQAKQLLK